MTTLNELPDAVVVLDGGRVIAEANDRASVLLALDSPAALLGRPASETLDLATASGTSVWAKDTGGDASALKALLDGKALVLTDAAGEHHSIRAAARVRRRDGALVVTLRQVRTAIDAMEIVATVSHELRSPLTTVKGYTSLLLNRWERLDDPKKRFMLEQIRHDADRVTRLVGELLDISRLETGRLVLHLQRVNLRAMAQAVVDKVAMEYDGLQVRLDFPDPLEDVLADPDKVEQVLTNLVENAAKYGDGKGLAIVANVDEHFVALEVHDRGDGIPPDELPRVFERFFRASHAKPTGTGLGLWISRGLAEAHGGRLTATSVPGEGSVFRFTLPR